MNYYFLYTNSSNKLWKKFVTFSEDILLDSNGTSSLNDIVDNVNNHIFIKALIKGKGILSNSETDFVNTYFPPYARINEIDRKSTRLNSSHSRASRMPSSA